MVAPSCFESFRSPVVMAGVRLGFQHFSQKCICVSPVMLSKKANQTWLDIDPEAERVLEFDQAAELVQLLRGPRRGRELRACARGRPSKRPRAGAPA